MRRSINSHEEHQQLTQLCRNPFTKGASEFWLALASTFEWHKLPTVACEGSLQEGNISWFRDGELNITINALDRHVRERPDHIALRFIPNDPKEVPQSYTYLELHREVNRWAALLQQQNLVANDVVCLYMPHIPQLAMAVLACARLGLVHSVVFGGFSAQALRSRIIDAQSKLVVTVDGAYRGEKFLNYKAVVDEALAEEQQVSCVQKVIVFEHSRIKELPLNPARDLTYEQAVQGLPLDIQINPVMRQSEDPLFILYTSGSTGKPKGLLHTTAGYMLWAAWTMREVFQLSNDSIFWCTADVGWITGHSYVIYGPLLNGVTTVMYEGVPTYPAPDRLWQIIESEKVTHFYTAPTAIRALEQAGEQWPKKYAMESLRVCGSVGEPINLEAWQWLKRLVAKDRCPIVDTWWQTETGGMMISNIAGVTPEVATHATLPLPGVVPVLLDAQGTLGLAQPWPGMARTIYGDHERYMQTYFHPFAGYYFTGDAAQRDANGHFRILGRMDDVINVSGHRLGTAELENVINESPYLVETAVVGAPHDIKGECLWAFAVAATQDLPESTELLRTVNELLTQSIGAIAKLDRLIVCPQLPKTRSGKIMRRFLRKLAHGERELKKLGDTSTLTNPESIAEISRLLL